MSLKQRPINNRLFLDMDMKNKIKQSAIDIDHLEREHKNDILFPKDIYVNLNIGRETLRYYEKIGLIHPHINEENGYRMFQQQDIFQLFMIDFLKKRAFSSAEIKEVMDQDASKLFYGIHQKKQEIEKEIQRLQNIKQQLEEDEAIIKMIPDHLHKPVLSDFPLYESIHQIPAVASFDQYQAFIKELEEDETCLSQLIREVHFDMEDGYKDTCVHIVRRSGMQDHNLLYGKCVYMLVESREKDHQVMENMFYLVKEWLWQHHLQAIGTLYIQPAFMLYDHEELIVYCHSWIFVK